MKDKRSPATVLQDRIIDQALDSLDAKRDVMIIAPTGAGKSRKFTRVAADRALDGDRILVLTNRKKLITQAQASMKKWADHPVRTSTGMNGEIDLSGQVIYSTVQTAHQHRDELGPINLVIVDEAHNAVERNADFRETLAAIERHNPDVLFMGATATPPEEHKGMPERLAKADMRIMTYEEAIQVRLVELPETTIPPMLYEGHRTVADVVEKHTKKGFGVEREGGIAKELGRMRGSDWPEQLVNLYERHMKNDQTIAFFDTIKEATAFVDEARRRDHPVDIVHSGKTMAENDRILEAFGARRLPIVVSVDLISEGVDTDATSILLDKKTTSKREYQQIVGRESRSHGELRDKRGKLFDTGASTYLHGDIGAIAAMSSLRGEIERNTLGHQDLLPDAGRTGFVPWVQLKTPRGQRDVYATSLDKRIVYATNVEDRYVAFVASQDKKGRRMELLAIDGERKGMPTRDGFGRWISDAIQRNEISLARLAGTRTGDMTKLAHVINEDWSRNLSGIESSIETVMKFAPPPAAIAQTMQRTATL